MLVVFENLLLDELEVMVILAYKAGASRVYIESLNSIIEAKLQWIYNIERAKSEALYTGEVNAR